MTPKLLYSGALVDLDDLDPHEFHALDIAAPLSRMPRWGGCTSKTITVAEHSVHVARLVMELTSGDRLMAACGLLHDAGEALIGFDPPTPVKGRHPAIREWEQEILRRIFVRFELPWPLPDIVKVADRVMLATEAEDLMPHGGAALERIGQLDMDESLGISFPCWSETEARCEFLREGQRLALW